MLILPKHLQKEIDLGLAMRNLIKGEYRIVRYNCMGQINYDTGWRRNLITDFGLRRRSDQRPPTSGAGASFGSYFCIGSGTTAPANSDTTMASFLAASSTSQGSYVKNTTPVAPFYEKYGQECKRFAAGVGTGTVNEVGIAARNDGTDVCARQLVVPGITKAADEVLDVYWRMTHYPDLTDRVGTVTISGITYDLVLRAYNVAQNAYNDHFDNVGLFSSPQCSQSGLVSITGSLTAPVITSNTSGGDSYWLAGYGDFYQTFGHRWSLNSGNQVNGIRTVAYPWSAPNSRFQVQFTAQTPSGAADPLCIPKDATKELTTYYRVSWARHP